jgi:4-aminobutyrate aminotransferase/(S)-3-amino-2-methylpropionate transaminase
VTAGAEAGGGDELPLVRVPPPGPRSRTLAARLAAVESPSVDERRRAREARAGVELAPIVYASARGANVLDVDGNRYVDLTAGFGALILGHAPNAASEAAARTASELSLALGDVYASEAKVALCERLVAIFGEPGARVMLGLSGADALGCALKTALLATGKPGVVAFEGSYHGLAHGPLAVLGLAPEWRAAFAPHLGIPAHFAPYPEDTARLDASLGAVRSAIAGGDVGAIVVEPLLGRGGCVVPPDAFLPELRRIADEAGALLVVDEVWTGMGRTGALLASGGRVRPDVICLGKGLGGGAPISACIGRGEVMAAWGGHGGTRIHTGTHFGSPPACAAALATLDAVASRDLCARAAELGASWSEELRSAVGERARVRGRGLMVGVELEDAAAALGAMRGLLERGFIALTGGAAGNAVTLSPPLTITSIVLGAAAGALRETLSQTRGSLDPT